MKKDGVDLSKYKDIKWEAFISGKPGQKATNRQIWVAAGKRLGLDKK